MAGSCTLYMHEWEIIVKGAHNRRPRYCEYCSRNPFHRQQKKLLNFKRGREITEYDSTSVNEMDRIFYSATFFFFFF